MDFNFFQPISDAVFEHDYTQGQYGFQIKNQQQSDFDNSDIVLIGIEDNRYGKSSASIRRSLYQYYFAKGFPKVYDLGDVIIDEDFSWRKETFSQIVAELLERNITICFIGGSQTFLTEINQAYAAAKKYMNIGLISADFNISPEEEEESYLFEILSSKPSYLFNFTQLGYQQYLVNPKNIALLKEMNFDEMRLGQIRDNIKNTEPLIRDFDILSISSKSVKQAELGGQPEASPNGLYSEELAQICRYAGTTEKLSAISFSDYDAVYDANGAGAQLLAQSVWCFFEGYAARQNEIPQLGSNAFTKYTVHNTEMDLDLVFIKSDKTNRWWMEMPEQFALLQQRFYLPCMYEDYEIALEGDIPERWLKGFNKLKERV